MTPLDTLLIDSYTGGAKRSAVYSIKHIATGREYIGVSVKPEARWKQHCSASARGVNTRLYRAIAKYGPDAFSFELLQWCDSQQAAFAREIQLIAELHPEFNMTEGGDGVVGCERTPEARQRMSVAQKIRAQAPGYSEFRSEIACRTQRTPEMRQHQRQKAKDNWQTDDYRARHAEGLKDKVRPAEELSAQVQAAWDRKTPTERAAWTAKQEAGRVRTYLKTQPKIRINLLEASK